MLITIRASAAISGEAFLLRLLRVAATLDSRFVDDRGKVRDHFRVVKGEK